uniref:Uncharacterized protein n=1 Tax=Arundo donax TaxID=35708 RepID=A0A0A8ZCF4_ARUDO
METETMIGRCTITWSHSNLSSSMNLAVPAATISTFLTVSSNLFVASLHDRSCAVATLMRLKALLEFMRPELTSSVRCLQSCST